MKLDDLNTSELVLLAQEENPSAHRGLGRDVLVRIIHGEEIDLPTRPVDASRRVVGLYIIEHWTQVEPLLTCPAKKQNPRACFHCTDIQAVECALWNKSTIKQE